MEVNKIQEELARLIELVDGWAGSHDVPGIERDLVLDKLKKLYEAIRFANFDEGDSSASASVAAQQSVAEVAPVSEISIDLDDLLAEPVRDSLPEPAAMPEALGESAGVSAAVPESAPSSEADAESKQKVVVSDSLFDLDDLVIRHREKRRVIMSLYETDGPQEAAASKIPVGTGQKPGHAAAPQQQATAGKEQDDAAAPQLETLLEKMDEPKKSVTSQMPEPQSETSESDSVAAEISEQADNAADADASVAASQKTVVAETTSAKTDAPKYPFAAEPEPVLGEVLGGDVHTLADTIAAPKDMASEIVRKERITDLKQAIGINDKFLLLRDLFGGDTERYERTIDRLNEFDDLDDCIIYISENYDWNPSSDGVRFLMELLERKLS